MRKIFRIISKFLISLLCVHFCLSLLIKVLQQRYEAEIDEVISVDDENIAFIKVLDDFGTWGPRLSVFCMFKDNDWMILANVRGRKPIDNIILFRYNGYIFYDIQKERIEYIFSDDLANKLGIKLETFSDFIKNKSVLDSFFESYKDGTTFSFQRENEQENTPIYLFQLKKADIEYKYINF